jgi:L-lactate dehydrogenase complex protein LldG
MKMNSKLKILANIKTHKPVHVDIPEIEIDHFTDAFDMQSKFKEMVEIVGGTVYSADSNSDVCEQLKDIYPHARTNISFLADSRLFNSIELSEIQKPHDLENLDILLLEGDFGVAENGAIWISDTEISIRVLPFIAKHLVLVVDKSKIVPYLHQAYDQLKEKSFGFGLFISGPSKTADIEQSLVIGAQGALSLNVFLK